MQNIPKMTALGKFGSPLSLSLLLLICGFIPFSLELTLSIMLRKAKRPRSYPWNSLSCTGRREGVMIWPRKFKCQITLIVIKFIKNVSQFKNVLTSEAIQVIKMFHHHLVIKGLVASFKNKSYFVNLFPYRISISSQYIWLVRFLLYMGPCNLRARCTELDVRNVGSNLCSAANYPTWDR